MMTNHDLSKAKASYAAAQAGVETADTAVDECAALHVAFGRDMQELRDQCPEGKAGDRAFGELKAEVLGCYGASVTSAEKRKRTQYATDCMYLARQPADEIADVVSETDARKADSMVRAHKRLFPTKTQAQKKEDTEVLNDTAAATTTTTPSTPAENKKATTQAKEIVARARKDATAIKAEKRDEAKEEARAIKAKAREEAKAIKAEAKKLLDEAERNINQRVEERVKALRESLKKIRKEQEALRAVWEKKAGMNGDEIVLKMSPTDYKRLRGVIHPDLYKEVHMDKASNVAAKLQSWVVQQQ